MKKEKGTVYIIGAGPGDPGLITIRGAECLGRADVVVHDHLVGTELLAYVRKDARLIYAGKRGGDHTLPQEEINRLLVKEAKSGFIVARLKGGDPFIFGRGGEEVEALVREGIPFEVVPGVTSAIAVPAYAGIPLTHRGYSSTVTFVTGHEDPTKDVSDIDWKALAALSTVVFLMGVKNLSGIVQNLIENGKKPDTPVALIRWGTTPDQVSITGTLADIVEKAEKRKLTPPVICVVGEVVKLGEALDWFERKPLFGKGVVITRPESQAAEFAQYLREAGARPILFPTIEIEPPEKMDALDRAIDRLSTYNWIIFTSANGVRALFRRIDEKGGDLRDLKGISIAAIGPATAALLKRLGIRVDLVPDEFISEGVLAALADKDMKGKRVLLPRAEVARDVIPQGLSKMGATVDVVTAYRTVKSGRRREELEALIQEGKVDVITFTSPSTVINFVDIMGEDYKIPAAIKVACIGPVTVTAARKLGLRIDIVQETYTVPGMVEAIKEKFRVRSSEFKK